MRRWIRIIRWIARIWSIPSIVALLTMGIGLLRQKSDQNGMVG